MYKLLRQRILQENLNSRLRIADFCILEENPSASFLLIIYSSNI